jgi:primosomal protein N' (replication factor Y)
LEKEGIAIREITNEAPKARSRKRRLLEINITGDQLDKALKDLHNRNATRQYKLLKLLSEENKSLFQVDALQRSGATSSVVSALEKNGFLRISEQHIRRDPLENMNVSLSSPLRLVPEQHEALTKIVSSLDNKDGNRPFLLYGITGSGKTEIYLQALAEVIKRGRQGIVLVPEISLTPQTIQRFWERFPGRVGVLHSQLSPGQRHDEWQAIKDGAFDVVIGPRSALGAPLPDIGLIIIDEEHDAAYKQQDPAPRYHARELAEQIARLGNAVLILGSATPDISSYHKSATGEYELLPLLKRIVPSVNKGIRLESLPRVNIIDMRDELKAGNTSIFSKALHLGINETLARHEQSILFLNRRGTATSVQCRSCGYIAQCTNCSTAYTFHAPNTLRCHQCNRSVATTKTCPECSSEKIRFVGIGTQRVVKEVLSSFPKARVLRWDRDTATGQAAHQKILDAFLKHEADILVGTQMLAKGLHFPLVSLVGAINGDIGLHLPDFRAAERTFQVLSQVAGRAGRGLTEGQAIIQTYDPENYAMQAVSRTSFEDFYEKEISFRRMLGYPPFTNMIRLICTHPSESRAEHDAKKMAQRLRDEIAMRGLSEIRLIGPAPAYIQRVRGRYRWNLVVQGTQPRVLLENIALGDTWTIDVNPVSLI